MNIFLLSSNFFYNVSSLPAFLFCCLIAYFELGKKKKRPNHATIFLSFELLEKVVSTCTNMASVI